jgi:hypothetical protein
VDENMCRYSIGAVVYKFVHEDSWHTEIGEIFIAFEKSAIYDFINTYFTNIARVEL